MLSQRGLTRTIRAQIKASTNTSFLSQKFPSHIHAITLTTPPQTCMAVMPMCSRQPQESSLTSKKKDKWDEKIDAPGTRGGLTITLHGDDRVRYFFSHLGRVKVNAGNRVEPGQWIGVMGSSGNARITKCHTHLGMSRICPQSEYKVLQGEIWPWRFLDAWRKGINKSPVEAKNRVIKTSPQACELAAAQD